MTVSEHGSTWMRWNWSRCRPRRVGHDRLDDVAVRDRHPGGVGTELGVPAAHGVDGPGLHRQHGLPTGEGHRAGVCLDGLPERFLGQGLQLTARPVAVAALPQPIVDVPGRLATDLHGVGRLLAALERARDRRSQGDGCQPRRQGSRLLTPLVVEEARPESSRRGCPTALAAVLPWRTRSTVGMARP